MHRIYSGAVITIIAAAGSDAEHGLPGVSVNRPDQINVQLGNIRLVQILPFDDRDIMRSTWYTRAWTYQESYFSNRRLIFTEHQVLFLCNDGKKAEGLPIETPMVDSDTYSLLRPLQMSFAVPQLIPKARFDLDNLRQDITRYTRRHLTYPSDSLNAFLGVIQYYMSLTENRGLVGHAWGVPLYKSTRSEFSLDLAWSHRTPATRRPGFPSWSWAGWAGKVNWRPPMLVGTDLDWCFQDERQRDITPDTLRDLVDQGDDHPQGLVITTKVCPVTTRLLPTSGGTSHVFVLFPDGVGYVGVACQWDEQPMPNVEYYAADLGKYVQDSSPFNNRFRYDRQMILRKKNQQFERIGISYIQRRPTKIHSRYTDPKPPTASECIDLGVRLTFDAHGVYLNHQYPVDSVMHQSPWYTNAQTQTICIV